MKKGLTLSQIKEAIEAGKTVCHSNEKYEVHYTKSGALRVSHVNTYFGCVLNESQLSECFILDRSPVLKTAAN